jgi:hypothetical protein
MPANKVDILIVGAQKSATTTLFSRLATHPQVAPCRRKEPGYFNDPQPGGLDAYLGLYEPGPGQLCLDGSTMYTFLPEYRGTAGRIHRHNPEAKIVYLVRSPIERIRSHLRHRWFAGRIGFDFDHEVISSPIYISRTCYSAQITPYLEIFGPTQVRVLTTESLRREDTAADLVEWLGLDPRVPLARDVDANRSADAVRWRYGRAGRRTVNRVQRRVPGALGRQVARLMTTDASRVPDLSPSMQARLWEFFEAECESISALAGIEVDAWHRDRALAEAAFPGA